MAQLAGVRFTEAGPVSYCSASDLSLGIGDYVIVSGERGERLGWVVIAPDQVISGIPRGPLRVIDRIANEDDVRAWSERRERAEEDKRRAQDLAARSDPRVRVAKLEYDLAGEYCEITFTADKQTEHEWFIRQASGLLNCNVHVEQVGDRDRAKAAGGLGVCGLALCCSTWQTEFPSISIKMAKEQGLSPNPSKISGVCGRLLCCLSFEVESYRDLRGDLPKVGLRVSTPAGNARVESVNALSQLVRMRMDSGQTIDIPADELRAQYGTAVRPIDVQEEVETPIRDRDRALSDALLARLTPVNEPVFAPERPTEPSTQHSSTFSEHSERGSQTDGRRSRDISTQRQSTGTREGSGDGRSARGTRSSDSDRPVRTSRRRPGEPRKGVSTTDRSSKRQPTKHGQQTEPVETHETSGSAGRSDSNPSGLTKDMAASDGRKRRRRNRRGRRGGQRPEGQGQQGNNE